MNHFDPPGRFRKCPIYMPRETAQSYLGRLTSFFGCRSPKEFCRDYMLDLAGIQHGEAHALRRMAAMTGTDPEQIIRWTPRRLDKDYMMLNGETLDNRINPRHLISVCPVCAIEDIAANPNVPLDQAVFGRCEWMVKVVDACAIHKVKLVTHRAPVRTAEKLDVGYETGHLLEELRFVQPESAELDQFQQYVLSRIGVIEPRPSPLLDQLSLNIVAHLCDAAGLDLLRHRGHQGSPTHIERRAAGFEVLGHGASGLEKAFLEMRHGMLLSEMTSRLTPRLLEYLYDSALVGRNTGDFVEVFTDICFRNLPYAKDAVLLGRQCPKRWLHDFSSAMQNYGVGRHHLAALVTNTPRFAAYVGDRREDCLVRVEVADALLGASLPFINQTEVARKLGRDPRNAGDDLGLFIEAGIVAPAFGVTAYGVPFYSEPQVDATLARFVERFEVVHAPTPTMRTTTEISMAYRIAYRDLWRMLANGDFKRICLTPNVGLIRGLRLENADVLEVLTGVADAVTTNQAAEMLGVFNHDVSNLVMHRRLPTLTLRDDIPVKLLHVFDAAVVGAFGELFISRRQLCKMLGRQLSVETLKRRGLEPAIELKSQFETGARTVFYRRDDLATIQPTV